MSAEYIAYDNYKPVKRVGKHYLEAALIRYEVSGVLASIVWELRRNPEDPEAIDARIAPKFDLNDKDDNWRSGVYTFYLKDTNES